MAIRKAVSDIVSAVIVIAVAIAIGALVAPWAIQLARTSSNDSATSTLTMVRCRYAALDFDTGYGTSGISSNFTGPNPFLRAKMVNKGTIDLYNFSFETEFNSSVIRRFDPVSGDQKSAADPLKPGQATILNASIAAPVTGTLNSVKIIPLPCTDAAVRQGV